MAFEYRAYAALDDVVNSYQNNQVKNDCPNRGSL